MLLPDGFTPTALLVGQAGDAAEGAFMSLAGMTTEDFPAAGQRFADALSETLPVERAGRNA